MMMIVAMVKVMIEESGRGTGRGMKSFLAIPMQFTGINSIFDFLRQLDVSCSRTDHYDR